MPFPISHPVTDNPTLNAIGQLIDDATNIVVADALTVAYHLIKEDAETAAIFLDVLNHNFKTCFK